MESKVYARKYRPKTFEEMIGQKAVVQTLQNAIKGDRLAQAYLFSGTRGVGKTTAARILAKALNCEKGPTPKPCNVCESCKEIDEDRSLDVMEIDGASNRKVEEMDPIRETARFNPMRGRKRIIYIDEVHMLSTHAFNSLLKTLEEPPPNTIFIFATTELNKVPATIVSRCQRFEFKRVAQREMAHHLGYIAEKEKLTVSAYGLSLIAQASEGSVRDAESLLDQAVSFCGNVIEDVPLAEILGVVNRSHYFAFSTAVAEEKAEAVFALTQQVVEASSDLRPFYKGLIQHFRDLLLVRTVADPKDLLAYGPEDIAALRREAQKGSSEEWLRWLQALQNAEGGLRYAAHPQIYFESVLVRLCHFRKIVPIQELLAEVEALKKGPAAPAASRSESRAVPPPPPARRAPDRPSERPVPAAEPRPAPKAAPVEPPPPAPRPSVPPPPAEAPEPGSGRRDPLRDLASKDPSLKMFVNRFKGRMNAVEPPAPAKDEEE